MAKLKNQNNTTKKQTEVKMLKWYRLIKFVKQKRKKGLLSIKVVLTASEFIIWNDVNEETIRIKY